MGPVSTNGGDAPLVLIETSPAPSGLIRGRECVVRRATRTAKTGSLPQAGALPFLEVRQTVEKRLSGREEGSVGGWVPYHAKRPCRRLQGRRGRFYGLG